MTECERIIRSGGVSKSFLEPETICDFYVDENRKKVWAIEIDLYTKLLKVCKKHNIQLFTDGGTTLGAVRHKGFIPWDDDLDVCLLRKDYDHLKSLSEEFSHPYFLQSPETDAEYGFSFMKLCNSNTTYEVRPFTHAKFNHGIHIDIFPIDKVTKEDYIERRCLIAKLIAENSAYMRRNLPVKTERDKEMINYNLKGNYISPLDNWKKIEAIAKCDESKDTEYLSLLVSTQYAPEKKLWSKYIFENAVGMDFSGINVYVPIGYKEQLSIYFGRYMQFPPIEQRGTWHSAQFFPDIPYKEYYKKHYNVKY